MRTLNIDFEDIHIVLARPSVADARIRRSLIDALESREEAEKGVFCYYITSLVKAEGTNDQKLTVALDKAAASARFDQWLTETDEVLYRQIVAGINNLLEVVTGEKKQSVTSLESTSAVVVTRNPETTTHLSQSKTA